MSAPSHPDEELLFRYHDGDLQEPEASEVRLLLERDPEARELLRRTEALGDLLRAALAPADEQEAAGLPSERLWDGIEARLGGPGEGARSEAPRPSGVVAAEEAGAGRSSRPRLRVVQGGRSRWAAAGMGAAVLAAAAAALLVLWPARQEPEGGGPPLARRVAPAAVEVAGSQVEEVDFGENAGTVFEVEGEAGQPLAVVWIEEEEASP